MLAEIDSVIQSADFHSLIDDSLADSLADALTFCVFPSANDANIIFYVSGYMALSVTDQPSVIIAGNICSRLTPWNHLTLLTNLSILSIFLDAVNRGGLQKPTDFTFLLAVHCWRVFEELKSTPELTQKFMTATTQRALFCKIMDRACCMETFGHSPIDSNVYVRRRSRPKQTARGTVL